MNIRMFCAIGAVTFTTVSLAVLGATLQRAIYNADKFYAVLAVVLLVALIIGAIVLDREQSRDQE